MGVVCTEGLELVMKMSVFSSMFASLLLMMILCATSRATELMSTSRVEGEHPEVGDWFEAEWFSDMIKIPLKIDGK